MLTWAWSEHRIAAGTRSWKTVGSAVIPVRPAQEPPNFDADVRQPGLRAIAELVGGTAPRTAGQPHAQVAQSREEIPAALFPPYWREALSDLLASYDRICSYLCLYIPRGTGTPSVDHMISKVRLLGSDLPARLRDAPGAICGRGATPPGQVVGRRTLTSVSRRSPLPKHHLQPIQHRVPPEADHRQRRLDDQPRRQREDDGGGGQ